MYNGEREEQVVYKQACSEESMNSIFSMECLQFGCLSVIF